MLKVRERARVRQNPSKMLFTLLGKIAFSGYAERTKAQLKLELCFRKSHDLMEAEGNKKFEVNL